MKKYTSNYFLEYCHFPKKYVWERKNEGKKISKRKNDKRKRSKKKNFNHYALLKKMLIVFCYQFQFAPFSLLI